jgi:hypothetical protein
MTTRCSRTPPSATTPDPVRRSASRATCASCCGKWRRWPQTSLRRSAVLAACNSIERVQGQLAAFLEYRGALGAHRDDRVAALPGGCTVHRHARKLPADRHQQRRRHDQYASPANPASLHSTTRSSSETDLLLSALFRSTLVLQPNRQGRKSRSSSRILKRCRRPWSGSWHSSRAAERHAQRRAASGCRRDDLESHAHRSRKGRCSGRW